MLILRLTLAFVLLVGLATDLRAVEPTAPLPEPDELSLLLQSIRANRKALIDVTLQLTPQEAEKFWPLYDRYQQEISAVGDRVAALIQDYTANFATLSDEKALDLIGNYLTAEADRLQVRRTYLPEFAKILPGRTVARFYQIENKIDAVMRYELAASIPVVEEKSAAPQ